MKNKEIIKKLEFILKKYKYGTTEEIDDMGVKIQEIIDELDKPYERTMHDGDCSIYACLCNETPDSGVCTCGFGAWYRRNKAGSEQHLYSNELLEKMEKETEEYVNSLTDKESEERENLIDKLFGPIEGFFLSEEEIEEEEE